MSNASIVEKALGHKLIGTKRIKKLVAGTILLLPDELVNFVTKYCWFVSSFTDGWSFTLRAEDLKKGEYLIFLSDELIEEPVWQIRFTLMHEIGHVVLGHRNSIGEVQTKSEIKRQEREADAFAKKYLGSD